MFDDRQSAWRTDSAVNVFGRSVRHERRLSRFDNFTRVSGTKPLSLSVDSPGSSIVRVCPLTDRQFAEPAKGVDRVLGRAASNLDCVGAATCVRRAVVHGRQGLK